MNFGFLECFLSRFIKPFYEKNIIVLKQCDEYQKERNSGCVNCERFSQLDVKRKRCTILFQDYYSILEKEFRKYTGQTDDVLMKMICQLLEYPNMEKGSGIFDLNVSFDLSKGMKVFDKLSKNLPNFLSSELLNITKIIFYEIMSKHAYEIDSMYNHYHALFSDEPFEVYIQWIINDIQKRSIKMNCANQNFDLQCLFFIDDLKNYSK